MSKSVSPALAQDAAQRDALLDAYFRETNVLDVLQSWLRALATTFQTTHVLPATPYPSLLCAIRCAEVERALVLHGVVTVQPGVSVPAPRLLLHDGQQQLQAQSTTKRTTNASAYRLCTTESLARASLWSVESVLLRFDADALAQRVSAVRAAVAHLGPSWVAASGTAVRDGDYSVTVASALVGVGTHFALAAHPVVELERHVVVAGKLLEPAMAVFARQLVKSLHDIASTATSPPVATTATLACRGIQITTVVIDASAGAQTPPSRSTVTWTSESVAANRTAFASAVKLAIVNSARIEIASVSGPAQNTRASAMTGTLVTTTQRFFFHFEAQATGTEARSGGNARGSSGSQQLSSRSFLTGSRVLESGVFLDGQGALTIATCLESSMMSSPAATTTPSSSAKTTGLKTAPPPPSTLSYDPLAYSTDPTDLVERVVEALTTLAASSSALRHWITCFVDSIAFALLQLGMRTQLLLEIFKSSELSRSGSRVTLEQLQPHIETLEQQIETLITHARVGSVSSLLNHVNALLQSLWQTARTNLTPPFDASDDTSSTCDLDIAASVEALETMRELLLLIAHSAVRDFVGLAQRHMQPQLTAATDNDGSGEQIDVLRALETAVETRSYQPLVAFESVFAQFVVDSCVDVALESAVMNVVAFHLPPNPFVELSDKLRAFAVRQFVWSRPLASPLPPSTTRRLDGFERIAVRTDSSSERALFGLNRCVLDVVDPPRVWDSLEWLKRHQVLCSSTYRPPKGSYSVQTHHALLALHPLAFARKCSNTLPDLVRSLEVVELVVVDGHKFEQALAFFADAVTREVRRLVALTAASSRTDAWLRPRVRVLGEPQSRVVSDVDYEAIDDGMIQDLAHHATLAKCVLHVSVSFVAPDDTTGTADERSLVHVVGKAFVFVFQSTAAASNICETDASSETHCLSALASFRIERFGVFPMRESAVVACQVIVRASADALPCEHWTPFAVHALDAQDLLLEFELDLATLEPSTSSSHCHLLERLTQDAPILSLYALVRGS